MKKICLVVMLQIAVAIGTAQKHEVVVRRPEPVNPLKDLRYYNGYTIKLMPAMALPGTFNNYGFEILKDQKAVFHQLQNPVPFSPKGVQKKEDAYKIAQWMIREYQNTGNWQTAIQPHIARELKLEAVN